MRNLNQYNYDSKRVLLRLDLNVPVFEGKILDDTRIIKIIPTIKYLLKTNAKIIIASHFGRPKGEFDSKFSLEFLAKELSKYLEQEILFCPQAIGEEAAAMVARLQPKEILLLENLRFYPGETKNDPVFAQQLANLADFYVNDAFSCSHRAHASIVKIAEILPSVAGLLLFNEIEALSKYLTAPAKPMMAIVGGSKVSTKLDLLFSLMEKVDYLCIGGAMANTFLKAKGYDIGKSFYEPDLIAIAQEIMDKAGKCQIILPQDVVVAEKIADDSVASIVDIAQVPENEMILDIGLQTINHINDILSNCKTLVWNGPLGVCEYAAFAKGTNNIAHQAAQLTKDHKLISIAGGGDIVAALSKAELFDQFTYISTAGGAFLEWLEGKELPGIMVLGE